MATRAREDPRREAALSLLDSNMTAGATEKEFFRAIEKAALPGKKPNAGKIAAHLVAAKMATRRGNRYYRPDCAPSRAVGGWATITLNDWQFVHQETGRWGKSGCSTETIRRCRDFAQRPYAFDKLLGQMAAAGVISLNGTHITALHQ